MKMLDSKDCIFLMIDIQEKLVAAALDKETVVKKAQTLAKAANILTIPTIVTEQYPKGLGNTVEIVKEQFAQNTPIIEKTSFSALQTEGLLEKIKDLGKKQIVICGIETHICVHQTTAELLDEGFEVFVAKDACASRNRFEFEEGISRMQNNGAKISCTEIILFEWLRSSKHPNFKEIQALIK